MSSRFRWLALAGATSISFAGVLVRTIGLDPVTTALYRTLLALPVLFVLWWITRNSDSRPYRSRLLAVVAGMFLGLDLAAWHAAIEHIGIGLATVLVNTQVLFVGAIAWWRYKERPTPTALLMVPVVFVGVILASGLGKEDAYGANPALGVVYALVGGVFYGMFLITLRQSNKTYLAPAQGPLLDATLGAALTTVVLTVVGSGSLVVSMTAVQFGWLIVLALSAQVFGWLLIVTALPRLPALETSVMILLQPLLSTLWALLIFDERLSAAQWFGVALVLGGVLVINLKGAVTDDHAPSERVA